MHCSMNTISVVTNRRNIYIYTRRTKEPRSRALQSRIEKRKPEKYEQSIWRYLVMDFHWFFHAFRALCHSRVLSHYSSLAICFKAQLCDSFRSMWSARHCACDYTLCLYVCRLYQVAISIQCRVKRVLFILNSTFSFNHLIINWLHRLSWRLRIKMKLKEWVHGWREICVCMKCNSPNMINSWQKSHLKRIFNPVQMANRTVLIFHFQLRHTFLLFHLSLSLSRFCIYF